MEEAYDYYQYNYCITLYLGDGYAHAKSFFNRQRNFPSIISNREASCIVYNKDMTEILDWGNSALKRRATTGTTSNTIYMDNFMNELHRIYPKYKIDPQDKDARMVIQSVTDFLVKIVDSLKIRWLEAVRKENTSVIKFHFVFVVPTHWEYSIREELLRPLFIATKLISRKDDPNRLLFFTKLDSILQLIQHPRYIKKFGIHEPVKKSQQYLMCGLSIQEEKLLINLDSFELKDSLLATRSTINTLIPRIFKSSFFTIDFGIIRSRVDTLLKFKVFDDDPLKVTGNLNKITEALISRYLNIEIEKHKNHAIYKDRDYSKYPLKKSIILGWQGLTTTQIQKIESITADEIRHSVFAAVQMIVEENIRSVFFYNFTKIRTAILVKEAVQDDKIMIIRMFVDWLVIIFNICGQKLNYKVMDIEDNDRNFFKINSANIIEGAGRKMLERIKVSDAIMPPHLIRRSSSNDETASSAIFSDAHPSIVINVDISFKAVIFSCALLSDNNHSVIKKIGGDSHSIGLQPLGNFFGLSADLDSLAKFKVKDRVIAFMEENFIDALNYFSKYDRQFAKEIKPARRDSKAKKNKNSMKWHHVLSRFASRNKIARRDSISSVKSSKSVASFNIKSNNSHTQEDFFSHCQPDLIPAIDAIFDKNAVSNNDEETVGTQQQKYIKSFLVMYLGYVNEIIMTYLNEHFGSDILGGKKRIGYAICIEKLLLRTVIGSKKDLRELLFASNILQRDDHSKKAQIIVQGEGLLPVLENNLRLDLKLKSYYVLAQINDRYINFTLNQVVQTGSLEEQSSAIIIQEEIIPIDDVYELLCKNIWSHVVALSEDLIECCELHEGEEDIIGSLKTYRRFASKIRAFIHENYATSKSSKVSTEDTIKIAVRDGCNCSIHLSLRAIIENGFRPVISNLANIISSTLVNQEIFGKFTIKSLFILGTLFDAVTKNPLNTILTAMIQEITSSSIEKKEMEAFCYTLLEPIHQVIRPVIGEMPFMHESFCKGCLHQVSRENYGLDFYSIRSQENMEVSYKDCAQNKVNVIKPRNITVLLQRGQAITNEGITKTFALKLDEKYHSKQISIRLIRFNTLEDDTNDSQEIIPLESVLCDTVQKFIVRHSVKRHHGEILTLYIMIKMKPKNHFSSLHFSAKMVGEDDFSKSTGTYVYLGEQLTLAYI